MPPDGIAVELQVSPILVVDLIRKGKGNDFFKTRTLLDTGSGNNWCHKDLLNHVKYNDLGSIAMNIQVFEGSRKRRYQYVEIFYSVNNQTGSLRCFVTDQYAWFNEVDGLTTYAAQQQQGSYIIDPAQHCDHDRGKKEIALILGPFASMKLRNKEERIFYSGNLLYEPYKTGNSTGYVYSGLLPKHLSNRTIYSYRITPMIKEHLESHGLKKGEIEFEPYVDQEMYEKLQDLKFMWDKETLGVKPHEYRKTDEIAMQKFHDSVEWQSELGKYSVGMPFNNRIEKLKQNKELAYARLFILMKKFLKDTNFAIQYAVVIKDYIEKYAEEVLEPDAPTTGPVCYLPHRAVVRQDSSTTKIRIVFDGSAKCGRDELCLNDCLMQGPNLVQLIAACIINFRTRKYAFSADLEKAFLQILIKEEHRDVLRFLFPADPLNPLSQIKVYRFKVVIFGANCSPFHLAAVIVKHLHVYIKEKITKDTLLRGLYVDNLFQTTNSPEKLINLFYECRQLFAEAGMNLRSWRSDLPDLNELAEQHGILEESPEIKVLGMLWDTKASTIKLQAKPKWNGKFCKRAVLSYANQHYDPLGFIVPIEVKLRIFIQELWDKGFDWEQLFDEYPELVSNWNLLRAESLISLTKILPRSTCNDEKGILHVFCDASKNIYGAVAYIVPLENSCQSELVKSKAKIVAINKEPKIDTIPKLELMALVIGSNVAVYCIDALFHIEIVTLYIWSDSKTALSWCSSYDKKEEFVSNRVRTIRENIPQAKLMYVESARNPADILTRKPKAEDLLENPQWWNGPEFLTEPKEKWPFQNPVFNLMPEETMEKEFITKSDISQMEAGGPDLIKISKAAKEIKLDYLDNQLKAAQFKTQVNGDTESIYDFEGFTPATDKTKPNKETSENQSFVEWSHWNSFLDIQKCYALVYACIDSFKEKKQKHKLIESMANIELKPLNALHFAKAKQFLIKNMQAECYSEELSKLKANKIVKYGKCRSFGLHLDSKGIIRCKGRFENSPTLKDINFPILCGTNHKLTNLMLWHIHDRENCPGYSYAMHRIKKDLYFPKFKTTLKKIFGKCAKCKIYKARAFLYPGNPPLPTYRTEAKTPFEFCGLDYAGPFEIKSHDFGGKIWICLFTCLVTRACHLVIVPDNSTVTFLEALKELQTFYRLPKLLLSDNATQFHAADRWLRKIQSNKVVQDFLGAEGIQWHFTPARASHMGGVFERMIGLLKNELRKMSHSSKFTYQEIKVHLLEVQRIMNSRPLTRATASLNDISCISPMDLIRGYKESATIIPEVYLEEQMEDFWEIKSNLPQLYLKKRNSRENFFKNLNDGYFETLRFSCPGTPQKQGQGQKYRPPKVGDVVLVKEDTIRPEWPKGIITELIKSSDGQIRKAKVMNNRKHILERAICDLYSLEINAEQAIPAYLDSRMQTNENSLSSAIEKRPQRQAAQVGRLKTARSYNI